MESPVNVCTRVEIHAGWIAMLRGRRNTHAAIVREIESMNARGYRIVLILPDEWGFIKTVWKFLVGFLTLGFKRSQPGILIVGEALDVNIRGMEMAASQP